MKKNIKTIIIAIIFVIVILGLAFFVNKKVNTKTTNKEETKEVEKDEEKKEEVTDDDVDLPKDEIAKTITCTYEGTETNVISEKNSVTFDLDSNNKVITRKDVREYQFDKVNIDDYINNKTLTTIAEVLNGINGIESKLETISESEHTYRFSTTFDFKTLNLDDLYNTYYKRFFTGDLEMTKDEFDERYRALDYDAMVKAYLNTGYTCK